MLDILKKSSDPKEWIAAAEYLNTVDLPTCQQSLAEAVQAWDHRRLLYTCAQLDCTKLVDLILGKKNNNIDWQIVFNAKACLGSSTDLQKIYDAAAVHHVRLNLNEALGWSGRMIALCPALKTPGNFATTEQLFQWGANPFFDNGNLFYYTVDECGVEMGKLYARNSPPSPHVANSMKTAQKNNNILLYKKFREIYWEYGRYTVADPQTLVEKRDIDPTEKCQMKIIFNFASCRVNEIYEWASERHPPVIKDFTFDDYGIVAIDIARQKLIELGGKPSDGRLALPGKKTGAYPLKAKQDL